MAADLLPPPKMSRRIAQVCHACFIITYNFSYVQSLWKSTIYNIYDVADADDIIIIMI